MGGRVRGLGRRGGGGVVPFFSLFLFFFSSSSSSSSSASVVGGQGVISVRKIGMEVSRHCGSMLLPRSRVADDDAVGFHSSER